MGKLAPKATLDLDRKRTFVMDLNAMVNFETATGKSIDKMDPSSSTDLRYMLWACLVNDDPELTLEDTGALIYPGNIQEITETISKVMEVSLPKQEGAGKKRKSP